MAATRKAELEQRYGVPVYVRWHLVPATLHTRSWWKEHGVPVPKDAEPDAIKGGGQTCGRPRISFLFSERNWDKR